MKKLLSLLFCFVLMGTVIAQDKYAIPEISVDKKLSRTYFQTWAMLAVSVDFAKSQGVMPYEYGKSIGEKFAPSWDKEAGFEGFVEGMIYNWECFKVDADGPMLVKEKDDGTIQIIYPIQIWKKYFPEAISYATFKEVMTCMQGMLEEIADYLSSEVKLKLTDESIIYEISKK